MPVQRAVEIRDTVSILTGGLSNEIYCVTPSILVENKKIKGVNLLGWLGE